MSEPLFKTLTELELYIKRYLPDAILCEDDNGEIVIYTNLYETDDAILAEFAD